MKKEVKLKSARLELRSILESDAYLIRDFELTNKEHFASYSPVYGAIESLAFWKQKVMEYLKEFKRGSSIRFLIFKEKALAGPIIGVCNFTQIFRGTFQACYLGYKIDKLHEGRGLMFEALTEACLYMFKKENLHRIMANYMPSNQRSEKLLNHLGFQKEGYAKQYLLINGQWEDHILTALTSHF